MTTTKIIQQDLKIFRSENNRDTDDGGGLRTGNVLTGADNELFDAIGDQSNTLGNFSMRLLYAGVDRSDDEPLLESGFIIAEPPINPNVSFIAFKAAYNGELRKNAVKRVEAYSIKTIPSRMTLLSQQTQGSRMVMSYQMPKEPDPKVGEVYCLDQDKIGYPTAEEYIKIRKVESEIREFYNPSTQKYFKRKVVKIETTNSLRNNYAGADEVLEEQQKPPCLLRETMVADAGKYFGVKKIVKNISVDDTIINVESIFDKIIPSSEVATALTDLEAGSKAKSSLSLSDGKLTGNLNMTSGQTYKLPTGVKPQSFEFKSGSITSVTDNTGLIKLNGVDVANIDYADGSLTALDSGNYQYSYIPAAQPTQVADTAAIGIDQTNQSLVYAITLDPPPLPSSVTVSYRSQGSWYDLIDNGSGALQGVVAGHGSGSVDAITNTVAVTLGALPDVGSEVIFSWATPVSYFDRSGGTIEPPQFFADLDHHTITPSTATVTYLDDGGLQKAATDDGNGNIIGTNFTATIDYADGVAEFTYTSLPLGGAQYTFDYSYGNQLTKGFSSPNRNADGTITLDVEKTNIKPHSVKMIWNVDIETFDYISTTPASQQVFGKVDPYITVFDDGNGDLKDAAGKSYGTINYSTGVITFKPDTTVKIPAGKYKVTHIGYDQEQPQRIGPTWGSGSVGNRGNKVYRNAFVGWEYRNAGVSMPIGPTGRVDVWFNSSNAANNHTQTATADTLTIDVTPLYSENIVGGSAVFEMGGKTYTERNGTLYYNHDLATGVAVEAGTINYDTGEVGITAWQPTKPTSINVVSLSTSLDKNPVDEVVFRVPQAPIKPQSLQLLATTLQGNSINVTADADGKLTGANIAGTVEASTGVVRCRFGDYVLAAGNESEVWYSVDALVGDKIFKPMPVFADSIKYNAVAYTYLPLDSEAIGVDTVRFPSDGRVPIYRAGDMVVVASRYKQDLGTSFTATQIIQLNVTDLTSTCVIDANNQHVLAEKYTTDLVAGTITMASPLDLSDYDLPLTAAYSVERTAAVSQVDISGGLTLTKSLGRDFDRNNTYVSSVMTGGKMQVYATKPFSQKVWDNVWEDRLRGDDLLVKLDTKSYPIVLTDDGAVTDEWVIVFRGGLTIDLYSRTMGHIVTTEWLTDLAPINPATNKPYFTIPKEAFGPTDHPRWAAGNCVRFNTQGAVIMPWIIRSTQPNNYNQTDRDGAVLCLRGNTVEI